LAGIIRSVLPRRIVEAVKRAFDDDVEMHFDEGGHFVRVNWTAEG
jgi:hypothetical protein